MILPDITTSGAVVKLYNGNSLIKPYYIPVTPTGNLSWHVFDLNAVTGAITDVNTLAPDLSGAGCSNGVTPPVLSVTPTTPLSFGNQIVNTVSPAQSVTIKNTGGSPLTISAITLGGTNPKQFAQTHNCPATLSADGSCVVSVTFNPTWSNTSPMTATLNVNVASPATSMSIALSGTTLVLSYTATPASLAFRSLLNVQSAAKTVTVSNTGTAPLTISSIDLVGTNPGQFGKTSNCGSSLAVGASCVVDVTFKPTSLNATPMNATLSVNVAAPAVSKIVALSGTLDYTVTPGALAFSSPLNVQSEAQKVVVKNTTGVPLTISGIELTGTNPGQFSITSYCASTLDVGTSCTVNVKFKPIWVNTVPMRATLNVNVATPATSKSIALSGTTP